MGNPPVDEEYFEWIDILESVSLARDSYTMMELGAGYGRWAVRAASALRQRGIRQCHLVAVEAEPVHFGWLQQHFADNGLDPAQHTLVHGAVCDQPGARGATSSHAAGADDPPDRDAPIRALAAVT